MATPTLRTTPTLRFTPSSIVRSVVIVGVALVVAGVAIRAAHPLMWFLQAATIAALSWPAVQRLARHMPAWLAVLALTGAFFLVVGAVAAATFTELRTEAGRFQESVPAAARRIEQSGPFAGVAKDLHVADQAEAIAGDVSDRFRLTGARLPGLATQVGGGVSATFVVWVLSVMLVFTGPGMVDAALRTLAEPRRTRSRDTLRTAYGMALRYMGLTSLRSVTMGAAAYVAAYVLNLDMPALLALLAAFAAFIPYVGITLGAVPIALLAILHSPTEAVVILVIAALAQVVDALVVQPRIDRASFGFGMFPTLVAVTLGVSLYGVIGGFIGLCIGTLGVAAVHTLGTSPESAPSSVSNPGAPE